MKWSTGVLDSIAILDRQSIHPSEAKAATPYLGLQHLDGDGGITCSQTVGSAGLKSSKFQFSDRHILFGKLRPYLRKIVRPGFSGVCSTDIIPILPKEGISRDYLFYFLRTPEAVQWATSRCSGANLPRLSPKQLVSLSIPVPPFDEQKRIAGILDRGDALLAKRREALAQLDSLLRSTFLDMFGDPITNPKGWSAFPLADFCRTGSGGTPSRKKMQRYYGGGTIPWVKSGELREEVISSTNEYITHAALKETNVKLVPKNALLLALYGATVGRLGILGTQATTNQAVCHIIPSPLRADYRYMFHCLSNQVAYLVGRGVGGAQPNISQRLVKSLIIPLPPLDRQRHFAAIVESAEQQKARQQAHLAELNTLFASLQSRAFRGDL